MQGLLGTSVSAPPSYVDVDGQILTKPNYVVNHFADYFVNKVNMLKEKVKHSSSMKAIVQPIDDNIMKGRTYSMALSPVSKKEVVQSVVALTDGKSVDYDFVDNKLL